jgi:uncharacterized protein DUF6788
MKQRRLIERRARLVERLPISGEIVRGTLLERVVRHREGCAKCARGEGHPVSVLTVSYAGGKTRQFSLHADQVDEVRRWLGNYQKLKEALEAICELNHELLVAERDSGRAKDKDRA